MSRKKPSQGIRPRRWATGTVTWQYRWTENGQRHEVSFGALAEAEDHRAQVLAASRQHRSMPITPDTFEDWWAQWEATREVSKGTSSCYSSLGRNHILPELGKMSLAHIRVSTLKEFRSRLRAKTGAHGRQLSEATVNKCLQQVGACLQSAAADGLIPANPMPLMPRRRSQQGTARQALSPADLLALELAMDRWWSLVVPFLVDTGLRIGELSALRVRDVDTDTGVVVVTQSRRKDARLGPTKTPSGKRIIPTLTTAVANRVRRQVADRALVGSDFLFTGRRGAPLDQDTFRSRVWRPAVAASDLWADKDRTRPLTPHHLRHTAITRWLESGLTAHQAARLAGHRTSLVTETVYAHLNPADLYFVREVLDARRGSEQRHEQANP